VEECGVHVGQAEEWPPALVPVSGQGGPETLEVVLLVLGTHQPEHNRVQQIRTRANPALIL